MADMIPEVRQLTTVDLTGQARQHVCAKHLPDDVRDHSLVPELLKGWFYRANIVSGLAEIAITIAIMMIGRCEHLYEMRREILALLLFGIQGMREIQGSSVNVLSLGAMQDLWQWSLAE
jgi:hypothetical protein